MQTEPTPAPAGSRSGLWIVLGLILAVGTGVLAQRLLDRRPPESLSTGTERNIAPQSATGSSEAPAEPAQADAGTEDRKLPETLPQFELADRAGVKRTLGHWKGQPLVVNYWATWCPPCVREIPLLSQLRKERRSEKLEVIGIAVDFRDDVLKFADSHGLDFPLLIGEEDGLAAVDAVGMTPAFPFTIFADSQQRIVAMKVGELHHDEATLIIDRVVAIDAGSLELAAARSQISEGLKELATQRGLAEASKASGAAVASPSVKSGS